MKPLKNIKFKPGVIHLPIIIALLAILLIPVIIFGSKFSSRKIDVSAANSINITPQAVQKIYQNGVPHTDKSGNVRNTYDPNSSFFLNGIFLTTNEPKDTNIVQNLVSAGFNGGLTAKDVDPQFFINQISGDNFKLIINNSLALDQNKNYDPNTFNETLFQTYKSNPSVIGWWLADEPYKIARLQNNDPATNLNAISQVYNSHKDQTNHAIFIDEGFMVNPDSTWDQFVNLTDTGSVYDYLKFFTTPLNSFEQIANANKEMAQAVGYSKPAWFIPQAFAGWPGYIYLTPAEEKALVYTSLIHGATGLIHFTWDSCKIRYNADGHTVSGIAPNIQASYPNCPAGSKVLAPDELSQAQALWTSLDASANGINKQIQDLTPVLLSKTLTTQYSVFVDQTPISSTPIRTMLKAYNGNYYLLAVNIDNAIINTSFQFQFNPQGPAERMFEGTQAALSGSTITDVFQPFAVHVYKFPTGNDSDLDSFKDTLESTIGTDPNSNCSSLSHTDAFPPDINADGWVTTNIDLFQVAQTNGKNSSDPNWALYKRRDMNADGYITLSDIFTVARFVGKAFCP